MKTTLNRRLRGRSGSAAVIAAVAVVIVVVVVLAILFLFVLDGGGGGSPEGVFNSFVDNYNDGDAAGALHCTDAHFMSAEEFADEVEDYEATGEVTVNNVNARDSSQMTSSETEDMLEYIDEFEEAYGLTVQDYGMVDYTISIDGDSHSDSMPCIKVDGKWYLAIMGIGSGGGGTMPLGLNQNMVTDTIIHITVTYAPDGARVVGTDIAFTHEGGPAPIDQAQVYWANATLAATYLGGGWELHNGATSGLEFQAGMTVMITTDGITTGDTFTFTSMGNYYALSTLTVS